MLCLSLAEMYHFTGRFYEELAIAERMAAAAESTGDIRLLARALVRRGTATWTCGQPAEGVRILDQAIQVAEAAGDRRALWMALTNVGDFGIGSGELDLAKRHLVRALTVAESLGDAAVLALARSVVGDLAYRSGDWAEARTQFAVATTLMDEIGISWASPYVLCARGLLDLAEGRRDEGMRRLLEANRLAEAGSNAQMVSETLEVLAECDLVEGRAGAARTRLSEFSSQVPDRVDSAAAAMLLAWAHTELGDLTAAETWLESAELISQRRQQRLAEVDVLRVRSHWHAARTEWTAAETAALLSAELARAIPYPYAEAKALAALGSLRIKRGAPEQARENLTAALTILHRLGERLYAAQIEGLLSTVR
jgi:tetratricopeptide (TPR) repeat protein